jgi:hypothetical protein
LLAVGCGGAAGNPSNHHAAPIVVTAQSGTISHSTTVNVTDSSVHIPNCMTAIFRVQ